MFTREELLYMGVPLIDPTLELNPYRLCLIHLQWLGQEKFGVFTPNYSVDSTENNNIHEWY